MRDSPAQVIYSCTTALYILFVACVGVQMARESETTLYLHSTSLHSRPPSSLAPKPLPPAVHSTLGSIGPKARQTIALEKSCLCPDLGKAIVGCRATRW